MIKRIAIGVILGVLMLSLGLNLYTYGYRWAYNKGYRDGVNGISNVVAQQFKDTGKIVVMLDQKQVTLIPENPGDRVVSEANQLMQ